MLDFKIKLKTFTSILRQDEKSYADSFNGLILLCSENTNFSFLNNLHSKIEIEDRVKKLKNRIIMHENNVPIDDIFDDYILCG